MPIRLSGLTIQINQIWLKPIRVPSVYISQSQSQSQSHTPQMQSSTSRLNSIIMLGATVLLAMSIVNHIHGRYMLYNPKPDITFNNIEVIQFRNTSYWEQLSFKYNLKASKYLSTLYTWNLKQLFVYVEVSWLNEDGLSNRMIVSDWILESPADRALVKDKFYIEVNNKQVEYNVRDVHRKLRGKVLDITLNAEYMPTVGFFFKTELYRTTLALPQNYV